MGQIQFAGSWYMTIGMAAAAWAATALPDTSVIGTEEDAEKAAAELEAYWWAEAQKIGDGAPDGVREDTWRADCRYALVKRIERSRAPIGLAAEPAQDAAEVDAATVGAALRGRSPEELVKLLADVSTAGLCAVLCHRLHEDGLITEATMLAAVARSFSFRFAAIAADGKRIVVWGLGATEAEARADAESEAREQCAALAEIRIVPVDRARVRRVESGDVEANDLWT